MLTCPTVAYQAALHSFSSFLASLSHVTVDWNQHLRAPRKYGREESLQMPSPWVWVAQREGICELLVGFLEWLSICPRIKISDKQACIFCGLIYLACWKVWRKPPRSARFRSAAKKAPGYYWVNLCKNSRVLLGKWRANPFPMVTPFLSFFLSF